MNELYPIIRRVRRPLLPPETGSGLVVPGSQVETSTARGIETDQRLMDETVVATPPAGAREEARRLKRKEKAS